MKVELQHTIPVDYYTEGPVMDANGEVYCTTLSGGRILRLDRRNKLSPWAECSCPNGQLILPNGDHLLCDSRDAAIVRFSGDGKWLQKEVDGSCAGQQVFVPNDLIADDRGGVDFTDSIRSEGKVFFLAANGEEHLLAEGLDYPNGLVLSGEKDRLFVAESYRNRVLSIPLAADGTAKGQPELFCNLPAHGSGKIELNLPDGMALDQKGRLWIAHYGMQAIQVVGPQGELIASVRTPVPLVSNLCFSTKDPAVVFVTGGYGEPGPGALCQFLISE